MPRTARSGASRALAWTAVAVVALALLTRIRDFLADQGDANVGTYYAVAHTLLHGSPPYVVAWEYKPPGLFALCAAALLAFGDAGRAASWLGTLSVIATALGLYEIARRTGGEDDRSVPALAAVTSVLLSTENHALPGDAELFVNAFAALAFLGTLARSPWRAALVAGAFAAAALQMKLTAVPIVLAVFAVLALRFGRAALAAYAAYAVMLVLPFGVEAALYARAGQLGAFVDANWSATLRRAVALRPKGDASQWPQELRLLAPSLELAVAAALRPSRTVMLAVLWFLGALVAVAAPGEWYARQFPLLVPPVALLGALGLVRLLALAGPRPRLRASIAGVALALTFFLHDYYEIKEGALVVYHRVILADAQWREGDYPLIRAAVRDALGDDRSFYEVQMSPEIYADLGVPPPTRYVFAGNLLEPAMWPMLGFAGRDELARVLAARPHVLAVGPLDGALDPAAVALLRTTLARDYAPLCEVRAIRIYRLRTLPARSCQGDDSPVSRSRSR